VKHALQFEQRWHRPRFLAAVLARLYGQRIPSIPYAVVKARL
jgi:hypothetical protein